MASERFAKNQTEGIELFDTLLNVLRKASREDDETYTILEYKKLLEKNEIWAEAIRPVRQSRA